MIQKRPSKTDKDWFPWKTSFVEARESQWHWSRQKPGSISLPDFIKMRAKGEAKMADGHVYLKKALVELFKKRISDAEKQMADAMTQALYGDKG